MPWKKVRTCLWHKRLRTLEIKPAFVQGSCSPKCCFKGFYGLQRNETGHAYSSWTAHRIGGEQKPLTLPYLSINCIKFHFFPSYWNSDRADFSFLLKKNYIPSEFTTVISSLISNESQSSGVFDEFRKLSHVSPSFEGKLIAQPANLFVSSERKLQQ